MTRDRSGRVMARTGLRMMPTSPSPSLKFRTAGFPQYGFKASLSAETCPAMLRVKPAPGMPCATTGLSSAFAPGRVGMPCRALSPNAAEWPDAAVREAHASLPQGSLAPARVLLSRTLNA